MAGPVLQITVGANVAAGVAGLQSLGAAGTTAATGLNNTAAAATNAGRGLNALAPATRPSLQGLTLLGRAGSTAATGIGAAGTAATAAAAALSRVTPGSNGATNALVNLGRVAQDAPFGLIGIANNIEPLITSFISVSRNAGGAAAGFRAIGASLLGPGGIILAIGLASTALTLIGQGIISFGGQTDKLRESIEEANKEAGKEIAQLQVLSTVAADVTRSTKDRQNAAADLQKQLKDSNITLSQEAILNGQVTEAINKATAAIKERAKARAIEDRIAKLQSENLDRELQRPEILRKRLATQKQLNAELAKETKIAGAPSTVRPETVGFATAARNELIALDQATLNTSQQINDLLALIKSEDLSFKPGGEGKQKKEVDLLNQRITALRILRDEVGLNTAQQREFVQLQVELLGRDGVKLGFTPSEVKERIDELIRSSRFGEELQASPIIIPIILQPQPVIDVAGATGTDVIAEDYAKKLTDSINQKSAAAFKAELDFGPAIADALSSTISAVGEGGDVFGSIFQAIGAGLKSLGSALIAYGVAAEAFKKTFSNPFAAIAAGAGLILAGSLLQRAIPKFANGITGFAGGTALVGETGPELVRLPSGSDVIPNNRLGEFNGSGSMIVGETTIYGADLRTVLIKQNARKRRI
jgi:hypothetical protein